MKIKLFYTLFMPFLFLLPNILFGQAPDLGTSANFAVFTATGAFSNDGATQITGDIGTHAGAFTGFPPGVVNGQIHVANPISAQAASDVDNAYLDLNAVSCDITLGVLLGNNQTITPNTYCIGAASTLDGVLILDGQCDPDALFIIKIDGALATSVGSQVVLTNSASLCNVYWQINGAVTLGENATFRGTILANGAISLLENASLFGRGLSRAGAIALHNNLVDFNMQPSASIVTADGATTFCEGGSVMLSGNCGGTWSSGDTTATIIATANGNYYVTTNNACGSAVSNNILVTVIQAPICTITGDDCICPGETSELCATPGADAYLWSTGATTSCITISSAGTYSVTVTDADGCSSICSKTVISVLAPVITCPTDLTVECDASLLPSFTGTATALNNCDLEPGIAFTDANIPGACLNEFEIARTWTATNACGTSSTCIQTLTVIDTEAPVITCPENLTLICADQVPPVDVSTVAYSDNCGGAVSVTHTGDVITDELCVNSFTLTRSYLATDACGNAAACSQVITVSDIAPPAITFVNSLLLSGDTLWVQCYGQDPTWNLPTFNEGSIDATDACSGDVTVDYNQYKLSQGGCENGIINLFRLSWIVTDECGNTDSVYLSLAMIDTIAPVIHGVPDDITVNCDEIPPMPENLYATDECLCVCILVVEESELIPGCMNGQVILRTWTAIDECGNTTTATQTITLVDETGPDFLILQPEIYGIADGTVLTYNCSDGGIPEFFGDLGPIFALGAGSCGNSFIMSFGVDTLLAPDCEVQGFLEIRAYTWVAIDECTNQSTMTIYARLIDDVAPVLTGVPDTACINVPIDVNATDDCGTATIDFVDTDIPNPCGSGLAVQRIYRAYDECGNSSRDTTILLPNNQTPPNIEFTNPILTAISNGDTLLVNCETQNGLYTSFGIADVEVEAVCGGLNLTFTEELLAQGDCDTDGIVATIELRWTATDLCGNSSELIIIANVMDESAPVFEGFLPFVNVDCNDDLPQFFASDNCGVVTFQITWDSIIPGACVYEYEMQRMVSATDECANTTTLLQTIQVGNGEGPTFNGIIDVVCNNGTIPAVTAYDACAGEFTVVNMVADTLISPCGMIIERIWTSTDSCGNTTSSVQTVIVNDTIPPQFDIPVNSFIYRLWYNSPKEIFLSKANHILFLSQLNSSSIAVTDNCDQPVNVEFIVDTLIAEDCLENGYLQYRIYTWTATDVCGNTATVSFSVYIVDDVPPVLEFAPGDLTVVCDTLPMIIPPVFIEDASQPVTVAFSEATIPTDVPGIYLVIRTWTATDACGNVAIYEQTIEWTPESLAECNIVLPPAVACNTHGVPICAENTDNMPGTTYFWEIVGEDCFIQSSPDSACILMYIGWSPVEITLTTTDAFGCVTTCITTLNCEFSLGQSVYSGTNLQSDFNRGEVNPLGNTVGKLQQLRLFPNPSSGNINVSFETNIEGEVEFHFTSLLGELIQRDIMTASKGLNNTTLNVSHVPDGSYLMQIRTATEVHTNVVVIMQNR